MRGWSPKVLWKDVVRSLTNTNSFQIILLSVAIHSVVSIFLIYLHLGWFFEYEIRYRNLSCLKMPTFDTSFARRKTKKPEHFLTMLCMSYSKFCVYQFLAMTNVYYVVLDSSWLMTQSSNRAFSVSYLWSNDVFLKCGYFLTLVLWQ